jgi:hypothetical protein
MNKILKNATFLTSVSIVLACATYIVNLWIFSSNSRLSPSDASFLEGICFIILGALLLLGSGGINRASRGAALLAATAEAISGRKMIGPSEMFRRDAWKADGSLRLGLILIIAGIILLIIYFVLL